MHFPISSIYLVSFSRSLHMHMNKHTSYVCVCGSVYVCVCACCPSRIYCCSPLWPKVNGWRINLVFSPSIVWGSSGSVLDADGSSVRDTLNHSETPHNNISIVYLYSLSLCFPPVWLEGKKESERSRGLVCTRIKLLEKLSLVSTGHWNFMNRVPGLVFIWILKQ